MSCLYDNSLSNVTNIKYRILVSYQITSVHFFGGNNQAPVSCSLLRFWVLFIFNYKWKRFESGVLYGCKQLEIISDTIVEVREHWLRERKKDLTNGTVDVQLKSVVCCSYWWEYFHSRLISWVTGRTRRKVVSCTVFITQTRQSTWILDHAYWCGNKQCPDSQEIPIADVAALQREFSQLLLPQLP